MWTCGKNFDGEGLQRGRGLYGGGFVLLWFIVQRGRGLYGGGFVLLWFIAFPIFDIA